MYNMILSTAKSIHNRIQSNFAKTILVFYSAVFSVVAVIQILLGLPILLQKDKYAEKSLTLDDFEQIGIEYIDNMTLITATDDPQLIYNGDVINMYVKCSFSNGTGEFNMFYNNTSNCSFSVKNMIYAKRYDGYYVFSVPRNTKQIRLDEGIFPSVTVKFEEIIINRLTAKEIFRYSTSEFFYLLTVPAILFVVGDCLSQAVLYIDKRKSNSK